MQEKNKQIKWINKTKLPGGTCIISCICTCCCRLTWNCKQNSVQFILERYFDSQMSFRFQKRHLCCWWCLTSSVGHRLLTSFVRHKNTPKKSENGFFFCVWMFATFILQKTPPPPPSFSPANIKNSRVWALWRSKRERKLDASPHNKRNRNETATWQAEHCQTMTYSHQCRVTLKWL